jgi:hypothetical protein
VRNNALRVMLTAALLAAFFVPSSGVAFADWSESAGGCTGSAGGWPSGWNCATPLTTPSQQPTNVTVAFALNYGKVEVKIYCLDASNNYILLSGSYWSVDGSPHTGGIGYITGCVSYHMSAVTDGVTGSSSGTVTVTWNYTGTQPAIQVPVLITGRACIADPTFTGPVQHCDVTQGPKNPYIGNTQQDTPLSGLTVDLFKSTTGYGQNGVKVASSQTIQDGSYALRFQATSGDYLWWKPHDGDNYAIDDYDLRDAAWSPSSYAFQVDRSAQEVDEQGDLRATLPNAVHWDWWGGDSSSAGTPPTHRDWLTPDTPNGFGGIGGGGAAVGIGLGPGATVGVWGMPTGQRGKVKLWGDGNVCYSLDDSAPSSCVDIRTGSTPWITADPVILDGVGRGGLQINSGSVVIGDLQVEGQAEVPCAVEGCPVFGPEYQGPIQGTVTPITPGPGGTTQPPVQSSACQLFSLPSHFDLAGCLSILLVPQRGMSLRLMELSNTIQAREPFASMSSGMGWIGQLWGFFNDDTLTICVPMLEDQLASQGIALSRPCVTITRSWTVYGWQPLEIVYGLSSVAIAWLWVRFGYTKWQEITNAG